MPTVIEAIQNFLHARRDKHNDLAFLDRILSHLPNLEIQVNVAADKGEPVDGRRNTYTDGELTWFNIRIPKNAASDPEFNDYEIRWPFDLHAEAIGATGWDWREEVRRRIRVYEREAKAEDARIDALMEEKLKRHELESAPEYARALAHWDRASAQAEEGERQEWARLKGLIDGGGANAYWDEVAPIMQARLQRIQSAIIEHAAKQAPLAEAAKVLAEKEKAAEDLQIVEEPEQATTDALPV